MTRRNQGGLAVLSAKVSIELWEEVRQLAESLDQTVSLTIARLLEQALVDGGAKHLKRDLADAGYQDGLRRGLHEARTKIAGSLKGSW